MHWRQFLDSEVIRFVDIADKGDITVRIKTIKKGKVVGSGGKSSAKGMITFEGSEKPMAAGTTVLSAIGALYGNDTRKWPGKLITIYGDPEVSFSGAKIGGVRVRPSVPKEPEQKKEAANG